MVARGGRCGLYGTAQCGSVVQHGLSVHEEEERKKRRNRRKRERKEIEAKRIS